MDTHNIQEYIDQPARLSLTSSAYDTAIVALACAGGAAGKTVGLGALQWLLRNQRRDGSWGASFFDRHDRLVCTLASTVVLAELGKGASQVEEGCNYLRSQSISLANLKDSDAETTVAFELIVPALLNRATRLGLDLPYDALSWVGSIRTEKLGMLPRKGWEHTTLVHTLETLDDAQIEGIDLAGLQCSDGSLGCSPSASAYAYGRLQSPSTIDYLRDASAATPDAGFPTIYRYELFDRAWVLNNLALAGIPPNQLRPAVAALSEYATDGALAMSAEGMPPDSDDTAVLLRLRAYCGLPADSSVLDSFLGADGYNTYDFERNPSVSSNIHVVHALRACGAERADRMETAIDMLRRSQLPLGNWTDKWNVSPYYATSHAVAALSGLADEMCGAALDWILATQKADGSWGCSSSTAEETAYALLALMHANRSGTAERRAISAGRAALERLSSAPLAELWIGKALYAPERVVRSTVLAAKLLYDTQSREASPRTDYRGSRDYSRSRV